MIEKSAEPTEAFIGRSRVRVGRFSYGVTAESILQWNEGANLEIGSFWSIARGVTFMLGGNHRSDWITTYPFGHIFKDVFGEDVPPGHPNTKGDIVIGNDVWIGDRATIMSGVIIGDGAVIAANAHVGKDVGPYEVWGGNPARKIRDRFPEDVRDLLLRIKWWDLPIESIRDNLQVLCSAPSSEALTQLLGSSTLCRQ
jgi:acetyltransferase-like isoleucine patch superfamily enzyme